MKRILTSLCVLLALILTTVSCKSTTAGKPAADVLTATGWVLSSINGKAPDATQFPNGLPDATFTTDNKMSGNAGCNRYSGTYTTGDKGAFTVGQFISTKMFCQGNGEDTFLKTLGTVNMSKITTDKLILLNGKTEVLVFVPKK
jgi:heat shock protein HslJ